MYVLYRKMSPRGPLPLKSTKSFEEIYFRKKQKPISNYSPPNPPVLAEKKKARSLEKRGSVEFQKIKKRDSLSLGRNGGHRVFQICNLDE